MKSLIELINEVGEQHVSAEINIGMENLGIRFDGFE